MAAAIILRRTANQFCGRYFSTAVNQSRLIIPSSSLSSVRKFSSSQSAKVSDLSDVKKVSLDESINNLYSKLESIKVELEAIRSFESIKEFESIRNGKELPKAVDATDEGVTERLPNESSDDDSDSVFESDSDDDSDTDGETEPESQAIQDNDSISHGNGEHEKYSPFIEGINSEIARAVNFSNAADEGMKIPEGFPFKLEEDRPGTTSIVLSREYEGERIEVSVQNPTVYFPNYYDCNDSAAIKAYERLKDAAFSMDLSVRVSCGNSNMTKVEFKGTAYKDRFCIYIARDPADGIDNEGVHLSNLDKGLQSEFHKYLEIRGIKPCTTNYIYQYMLGKANREKLRLLQKFKNLV